MGLKKSQKTALIVEDEEQMYRILEHEFKKRNGQEDCPYEFVVEKASSVSRAIEEIFVKKRKGFPYNVISLDMRLQADVTGGLQIAHHLRDEDSKKTVVIVFTGHPKYEECVQTMRYGAWDYIVKQDVGGMLAPEIVVNSAVTRLCQLDRRERWKKSGVEESQTQESIEISGKEARKIASAYILFRLGDALYPKDLNFIEGEKKWRVEIIHSQSKELKGHLYIADSEKREPEWVPRQSMKNAAIRLPNEKK